jgi:hypothetical protein
MAVETNKNTPPPAAPPVQAAAPAPAPDAAPASPPAPAATTPPGQIAAMPASVRQAVLDAAAAVIEQIQGIAMAVGEAPVDENAPIPPEISACLDDVAATLMQLSESLEPAGAELDMAKNPPPPHAPPAQPGTPAPAAGAPPPPPPHEAHKSLEDRVVELVRAEVSKGADLKASIDRLTVQLQAVTAKQLIKSLPTGNGQPSDGGKPPAAPAPKWPDDLAEAAKTKRLEKARSDAHGR